MDVSRMWSCVPAGAKRFVSELIESSRPISVVVICLCHFLADLFHLLFPDSDATAHHILRNGLSRAITRFLNRWRPAASPDEDKGLRRRTWSRGCLHGLSPRGHVLLITPLASKKRAKRGGRVNEQAPPNHKTCKL